MAAPSPPASAPPPPDAPEQLAARRAGEAARRVLLGLIASQAPADELAAVAEQLEEVADRLAPHAVRSRYDGTKGLAVASGGAPEPRIVEHHLLLGAANPLAPPLHVERDDDGSVRATVTYDLRYEGMPGWVHGGAIALAFDLVLGLAVGAVAERPAVTGTLNLRYRKPSKLWTELVYSSWAETVGTRTIRAFGSLTGPDGVCVEADGIWVRARTDVMPPVE